MNKCILTVKPDSEVTVTEIINHNLGRKTGFIFESKEDDAIEVSDGHHTMDELYEHRIRLYLALVKIYDNYITPLESRVKCWKTRVHDDGSSYPGWFLLGMTVTQSRKTFDPNEKETTFDISYHIPDKYWHLANVIELEKGPVFTGYTPNDVLERLLRL